MLDYDRVAHYYDLLVQAEHDIPFFLDEAQRARGRVLELMAGTGRVALPLIRAGVDLTCLDASPAMLAILRKRLSTAQLFARVEEADVRGFELGERYALIFIAFNAYSELCPEEDRRLVLRCARRHLDEEGRLIVTLHNPGVRKAFWDGSTHEYGRFPLDGGELVVGGHGVYDRATGIVEGSQSYHEYDGSGALRHTMEEPTRFSLIEEATFRALARDEGFVVREIYGDYDRSAFDSESSPYMIWVTSTP